jgi:hypothetical protein
MAPVMEAIQAMRGVASINAVTLAAEIGDFARFVPAPAGRPQGRYARAIYPNTLEVRSQPLP